MFSLSMHPSTGYSTNFSTRGKETTYVYGPLPLMSTPLICGRTIPGVLSMWLCRDYATIFPPALLATQPGFLPFPKHGPLSCLSPFVCCCTLLNPNEPWVHTIALVLPRFFRSPTLSNILITSVSVVCTQMVLHPSMWQSSA